MEIQIRPCPVGQGITIVTMSGRVDAYTQESLQEQMNSLIRIGSYKLVCNMEKVEYIAGGALKMFLSAMKEAQKQGGDVKLCCLSDELIQILAMSGFTEAAQLYISEEDAIRAFGVKIGNERKTQVNIGQNGSFEQTLVADSSGIGQTLVAGQGDFEQTLIASPKAPSPAGGSIEETLITEPAKPRSPVGENKGDFEQTLIEAPKAAEKQTGFEETLIQAPPSEPQSAQPGPVESAEKEEASADAIPASLSGVFERGRVEEKSKAAAKEEQSDFGRPFISPMTVTFPSDDAHLANLSEFLTSAGRLVGISVHKMSNFCLALTTLLEGGIKNLPKGTLTRIRIDVQGSEIRLRISLIGQRFDFLSSISPQGGGQVLPRADALEWLQQHVETVEPKEVAEGSQISLIKKF